MPARRSLEVRSQVGQLMIMGFDGTEISARLRTTFSTMQPGGIILFGRNIESAVQTNKLLRDCHGAIASAAFLCVDMEGGTVDRLRNVIAPAPSAADVFATGGKKLFRKHGRILGEECRAIGFNVDFVPVLDLALGPSRPVLASRTVSADPRQTLEYAREVLKGLRDAGVMGCGKHFPGLGEANLDTHKELPAISKPWKRLWNEDLYPYRALVKEMPFVMVAHAAYPDVTADNMPASISRKWLREILRKKIGYKGLIIADDLEMGGVAAAASIEDAAIRTIEAGSDMFPVCHNEEAVWRAFEAVLGEAERQRRFRALVQQAARRVLASKKKWGVTQFKPKPVSEQVIEKLRRALWEFGEEIRLDTDARAVGATP